MRRIVSVRVRDCLRLRAVMYPLSRSTSTQVRRRTSPRRMPVYAGIAWSMNEMGSAALGRWSEEPSNLHRIEVKAIPQVEDRLFGQSTAFDDFLDFCQRTEGVPVRSALDGEEFGHGGGIGRERFLCADPLVELDHDTRSRATVLESRIASRT